MPRRFDDDARRVALRQAAEEAQQLGSTRIEAEHLLLALSTERDNPAGALLTEWGLGHEELLDALERESERSLAGVGVALSDFALPAPTRPRRSPKLAASGKRALARAARLAVARKDRHVTQAHLVVGILRADIGTVPRALAVADVDRVAILSRAEQLLG